MCVLNKGRLDLSMDGDPPSEPPDPGGFTLLSSQGVSRKRQGEVSISDSNSAIKKTIHNPDTATPSIQNVYINPSMSEGPLSYNDDDKGPFIVYVSRETPDPAAGTTIRAIKFGQFLHNNKIPNIINDGVKNVGRNKIAVQFSSAEAANNFLKNPVLSMCKYVAVIPTFNITRMGLIKGVPVDWAMDEFIESLELPPGCGKVMKARRLNRKNINEGIVTWVPTQSVAMTFRGQMLPEKVYSYHTSLPVETYKLPTIQCLNCCRFGHIKAQCRSKPRCYRCSQSHTGDACNITKENSTCIHCTSKHFATDKDCPEFLRQQSIKMVMSQENVSYIEASSRFPTVQRSYADVAKEMFSLPAYTNATSSPIQPQPSSSRTYRQTVFRSPRPRAPLAKGYDRQAHQAIVSNCSSPLPNGCALNNDDNPSSPKKDLLLALIETLISIISSCDDVPLPSNVAQKLMQIFNIVKNGPTELPSVEL